MSNLVLHILLTIKIVFTNHFRGKYSDASLQNILIQRTDLQYVQYGSKKIQVLGGIIPILCDFGASRIVIDNKIFMRTNWKNNSNTIKTFNCFKHDTQNNINDSAYDIFVFFQDLRKNIKSKINEPIMEAHSYLAKKKNNFYVSWKNYEPNCVILEDLFCLKSVQAVITSNEFIE